MSKTKIIPARFECDECALGLDCEKHDATSRTRHSLQSEKAILLQFEIHKAYADYWNAMAVTGVAKSRDITNLATGQLTDEEKTKDALDTMLRHIHGMSECKDALLRMRKND